VARSIAVTFDYRCPFAYNGNAAVIAAVRAGSDVDFHFTPFSLDQAHVEEGGTPVWDRSPDDWGTGTLALQYGIAARDAFPDQFFDVHLALFAARHDKGLKIGHEDVVRDAVAEAGLDPDAVAEEVASGRPLKALATEHAEGRRQVGGVGGADLHRGRRGGLRALHGARPRRRPRADARPAAVDAAQRVQAQPASRADQHRLPDDGRPRELDHDVGPLLGSGIAPLAVRAPGRQVAHVEVQGRRVVGQLEQLARTRERWRVQDQSATAIAASTRLRQLGHADTVASSKPPVTPSRSPASEASNATDSPSASRTTRSTACGSGAGGSATGTAAP